jgi:hypothetical protein
MLGRSQGIVPREIKIVVFTQNIEVCVDSDRAVFRLRNGKSGAPVRVGNDWFRALETLQSSVTPLASAGSAFRAGSFCEIPMRIRRKALPGTSLRRVKWLWMILITENR